MHIVTARRAQRVAVNKRLTILALHAALLLGGATLAGASADAAQLSTPVRGADFRAAGARTFRAAAANAARIIADRFYRAPGRWNLCVPGDCGTSDSDWGADALTYALYLRWRTAETPGAARMLAALAAHAPMYAACPRAACSMWSDVPLWDAVAALRAFQVTGRADALRKARLAFDAVDASDAFALGACPTIDFQQPGGGANALKTLETDSNYIKAALLLARATGERAFVAKAQAKYAAVRRYFLDARVALYSVYVFDDGRACRQLRGRFFASVNGNMIDNGLALARQTGDARYRREAFATARAVARYLGDSSGVYANLQAGNDIAEPLVEAMYDIAIRHDGRFARRWLLTAAAAAHPTADGVYGRFFDGPPPRGAVPIWSSNGGLALAIAAGALAPDDATRSADDWSRARFVANDIRALPASIAFSGRAIALVGTLGDVCCEAGRARVFIDGKQTFDTTGIWQNKSPVARHFPRSVLFSWRWSRSGRHTIRLESDIANPKEGGSFIHLTGYEFVR